MSNVEIKEYDIDILVKAAEGPSFYDPPVAYQFQSGREFKDKGIDSSMYNPVVTDPEFTGDGTAWDTQTNATGFGTGVVSNTSTSDMTVAQSVTVTTGAYYEVTLNIRKLDSGTVTLTFGGVALDAISKSGVYSWRALPTATTGPSLVATGMSAAGDVEIDSISAYKS